MRRQLVPWELLGPERAARAEQRANALTGEAAARVQAAITARAEATGPPRCEVERELKRVIRHSVEDDGQSLDVRIRPLPAEAGQGARWPDGPHVSVGPDQCGVSARNLHWR
ncbi:hypothetical protein ACIODT_01825 [Streptomyces sp. NPDC088251]|uniref:hypothetical protein n=1 Tax=Streptomyces sp. NPDC088251 TaxID=3365844 RepID=UPI00380E77FF